MLKWDHTELEWALNSVTGSIMRERRGRFGTHTPTWKKAIGLEWWNSKNCWEPPETRRKRNFSRNKALPTLSLERVASRTVIEWISVVMSTVGGVSWWQPWGTSVTPPKRTQAHVFFTAAAGTFNYTIHSLGSQINMYQAEPSHHNHFFFCSPSHVSFRSSFFVICLFLFLCFCNSYIFTHLKDSWVLERFGPWLQCLPTPTLFPEAHISSHLVRWILPKMSNAGCQTSQPFRHSWPVRPMFLIHCGVNIGRRI